MQVLIPTLEALHAEAKQLVGRLSLQEKAVLITLSGDLGAGKTAFTKEIAKVLGIDEPVTSPTFVLEKIYALPPGGVFSRLVHIDAYRLSGGKELGALGFSDLAEDPETLILLEWPERVEDALPEKRIHIQIEADDNGVRTLTYA